MAARKSPASGQKPAKGKGGVFDKKSNSINRRGGKRPGAGRKAGSQNKVTVELKEAARGYTTEALRVLVQVAKSGKSESARVAAASAILDRGHGKPKQEIDANLG